MFFKLGRHAVYKFGASDERLQELRANNFAMFEAIRYLAEGGAETLHFGRTEKENQGLRRLNFRGARLKKKWAMLVLKWRARLGNVGTTVAPRFTTRFSRVTSLA